MVLFSDSFIYSTGPLEIIFDLQSYMLQNCLLCLQNCIISDPFSSIFLELLIISVLKGKVFGAVVLLLGIPKSYNSVLPGPSLGCSASDTASC